MIATAMAGISAISAPAANAAELNACYQYKKSGTKDQAASAVPIECTRPHTAQTYWAGTLPNNFGVPEKASISARLKATSRCTTKNLESFLGMANRKLPSRFTSIPVMPTKAQWNAGERWVRCDAALLGGKGYQSLKVPAQEFVAANAPETFNFCTPGVPGNKISAVYPCLNVKKNWILIKEKQVGTPTSRYPGNNSLSNNSNKTCKAAAKPFTVLKKYYPFWQIWPSQAGWQRGSRTILCFVPYKEFMQTLDKHPAS